MAGLTLIVGNKNYSSWSLRPWLLLTQAGIPFREEVVPLYEPGSPERMRTLSPSGKVPVLIDDDLKAPGGGSLHVWDSLAIAEHLAERFADKGLWPADAAARARARSVSAEMHSGFAAMREHLSMNIRRRISKNVPAEARADVDRVQALWRECRREAVHVAPGPFLFGAFSIADAMFAPVAFRFQTYGIAMAGEVAAYSEALLGLPGMRAWEKAAHAEVWVIDRYEAK